MRGCERPLELAFSGASCANGHSFDRSRSGYWNLLQPQDRRSRVAGDSVRAARARRRLFELGHDEPLLAALREGIPPGARVVDVGCGEGSLLTALRRNNIPATCGIDLSAAALDLAARADPLTTWVVANADRGLPLLSRSCDVVLSITARRPAAEIRRVLESSGHLWVAIPGADDLAELRELVEGKASERDRADDVRRELEAEFSLSARQRLVRVLELDRAGLADLLAASYRIARGRPDRLARWTGDGMRVTIARDLLRFTPRQ